MPHKTKNQEASSNTLIEAFTREESERERVVQRIHDDILQSLGTGLLRADVCSRLLQMDKQEELAEALVSLRQNLDFAIESLRDLMIEIRPYDPDQRGVLGAIEDYAKHFERVNNVEVVVEASVLGSLGFVVEIVLYHSFQEALNTAAKQLGMESIVARLDIEGAAAVLEISQKDDGHSLRDRIAAQAAWPAIEQSLQQLIGIVGGRFYVSESSKEAGRLEFRLPLGSVH